MGLRQRGLLADTPASETYRGAAPAVRAGDHGRSTTWPSGCGFTFLVNYHSAAELLLYGVGWQVATPAPDDLIYEAMLGDDAHPAVPGYDPDIGAELYTTNGETDGHMTNLHGTLAYHTGDVHLRGGGGERSRPTSGRWRTAPAGSGSPSPTARR